MSRPASAAGVARLRRPAFALLAVLAFASNVISLSIGSWKDSALPPDAGFSGTFAGGWQHMLNQPAYFTFMSNFLVGLTSLLLAIRPERRSDLFHAVRIAAIVCIIITGVVFNLLLRDGPMGTSIEHVNDTVQHIITPVVAPLVWLLLDPRGAVTWKRIGLSAVIPLGWLAFTLVRGPYLDWYPYSILDVPRMGYGGVAVYVVAILVFYLGVAALMWVVDRRLARRLP